MKTSPTRTYRGKQLDHLAFPLGGIGAGMIGMEGCGALSRVSLRHKPDVFHEPRLFGALHVAGAPQARVLQGPVPTWKLFSAANGANGGFGKTFGLPRFANAAFTARFPFGTLTLDDPNMPLRAEITAWSPFVPGDADNSSLPVATLEYRFVNATRKAQKAVFSFHAVNFMSAGDKLGAHVRPMARGFVLSQPPVADKPWEEGHFALFTDEKATAVDCAWFRGGWFDPTTMLWKAVSAGEVLSRPPHASGDPGVGGSLYVPFTLKPREARTIRLHLAWYVPLSAMRHGAEAPAAACEPGCACGDKPAAPESYRPWYAARFDGIAAVCEYWRARAARLRKESLRFSDCLHDSDLPPAVLDAVSANLAILKSPTCLRQADGRFWAWEGCHDASGCCIGTCTHVWNYAQAMPHLFPSLERTLRETEFGSSQDERGHQNFRASLPIRPTDHTFHAAADGQLGGLMKLHRDWRISGDTAWMRGLWPRARQSLDFCIATWDPEERGLLVEPHHNTYDIEFWGADGMCTSFYLGALQAAIAMGRACGEDVARYEALLAKGRAAMESMLWNGEYFIQKIQWQGLRAGDPVPLLRGSYSAEALAIMQAEGPKYQYGEGCLSDGVLGDWLARCCGLGPVLDEAKTAGHAAAVFKHNFRRSLTEHVNPQRPTYALGGEAGLLLCSWPRGGKPSLPFVYSDEVWTGIEYAVASLLAMTGAQRAAETIVRATRDRYDGAVRDPFDEYECGHWYARAMSSYALLQAWTGARYDAVTRTLFLTPPARGDCRALLCTATGYGTVGFKKGQPFLAVRSGKIPVKRIVMETPPRPAASRSAR